MERSRVMLVECTGNIGIHLPPELLELGGYGTSETDYCTTIGKLYVVYAMSAVSGRSVHYFLDPERLYGVPAELFRLRDGRISRHWVYNQQNREASGGRTETLFLWGYPEYVEADHFLELIESRGNAADIFESYRRKMEIEFALPTVTCTAESIGEGWVMCGSCADAWQPASHLDEMGYCPACGTIQLVNLGDQSRNPTDRL